jgi:hypothetical protein
MIDVFRAAKPEAVRYLWGMLNGEIQPSPAPSAVVIFSKRR